MKIILSRKGFDSKYGGYPSPILPNDKMISLPVPNQADDISYGDLKVDGKTYQELIDELDMDSSRVKYSTCHLDPDIRSEIYSRSEGWRPIFGQSSAAQGLLSNQEVGLGDLFLFWGWFRKTKSVGGKLKFDGPNFHAIYGYLQVGKMSKKPAEDWMHYHSHAKPARDKEKNNMMYIARDALSFDNTLPGAGVFKFHEDLVLTKKGLPKSKWDLPTFFKEVNITYHPDPWKEGYFQSRSPAQEFVIKEPTKEVTEWAEQKIKVGLRG